MTPHLPSTRTAFAICLAVAGLFFQLSGVAATHTVNVGPGLSFTPSHLTINVGETVNFRFTGLTATVTQGTGCVAAPNPLFNSSSTFAFLFTQAGTYPYFSSVGNQCQSGMTGVITVVASNPDPDPGPGPGPTPPPSPISFDASQSFGIGGSGFLASVAVGDVNGDGIDDAVTIASQMERPGNPATSFVSTVFGNSDALAAPFRWKLSPPRILAQFAVADFDADGFADLAVADLPNGGPENGPLATRVTVMKGNGDGTFGTPVVLHDNLAFSDDIQFEEVRDLVIADVDGDGHLDVLYSLGYRHQLIIVRGTGGLTFAAPVAVSLDTATRSFDDVAGIGVVDVDGDGRMDIVVYDSGGDGAALAVFERDDHGVFVRSQQFEHVSPSAQRIATGDVNGDGFPDVVTANTLDNTFSVFRGSASGLISTAWAYAPAGIPQPFAVDVADLDGDGFADILVGNGQGASLGEPPSLLTFLRGGSTIGAPVLVIGGVARSVDLATGDFNDDGLPDIASVYSADIDIVLQHNPNPHDRTPPVITVPDNFEAEAGTPAQYTVSATDARDGTVTPSCSPGGGFVVDLGPNAVDCTATDAAGNVAHASFVITGVDTTAPALTLPGNLTVDATCAASAVVSFTASAYDTVSGDRPVDCAPASGSTFLIGTRTVSCTAADAAGNDASGSFTVTVRGPLQLVANLKALAAAAGMSQGDNNLDNVIKHLTKANGNTLAPAINNLNAFINKAGKLPEPQRSAVIAAAQRLRIVIGC